MIPHINQNGSLTPWGAQQQLGLLVKDPVGKVAKVVGVHIKSVGCYVILAYANNTDFDLLPCRMLRPHPVPLTPETAYVGQWVREIERPYLIGQARQIHGQWNKEDGDDAFYAQIVGPGIDEFEADISEYEALPDHCQDTLNPNQDA